MSKSESANQRAGSGGSTERGGTSAENGPEEFFWLYDPERGSFVYVGASYVQLWQRSRGPLYEGIEPYFEGIHAEDRARVRHRFEERDGPRYDETYRVVRPDGSTCWVRDRAFPLRAGSHSFPFEAGIVTAAHRPSVPSGDASSPSREGTPRKTLRIDRSPRRYERLFSQSHEARFLIDTAGVIVEANRRAGELVDAPVEHIQGKALATLWRPEDRKRVAERLERVQRGSVERFELPMLRDDQSEVPVEATAEMIELGPESIIQLTARRRRSQPSVSRELESTRDQLVRAQKMEIIGQLAGGLAHDFNNLLSIILSCTTFIERELGSDSPLRRDTAQIRQASESAASLVRRLLGFARREVGRRELVDPAQMLDELRPLIARAMPPNVTLEIEADEEAGLIRLVPVEFEQVVMNLAINARDAMPDGGTLHIELAKVAPPEAESAAQVEAKRFVRVRVRDTGQGMDAQTRARIFEPFYSTKGKDRGTGLGLPTVLNLVERNDGLIRVASRPQQGSTFDVYFPCAVDASEEARQLTTIPTLGTGDEVILVVDDDEDVRRLVDRILAGGGYTVLTATSAAEALEVVRRHNGEIDLLLTDVIMPETAGPVLAEQVRREGFDVNVLFTSGYIDDPQMRREMLEAEAQFIAKPLTPDSLLNAVREAIECADG